jgi:serine/threonine protein kinase
MTQSSVPPELVVGSDFVIKRRIKAGGFGTVYEALQLSTGQRRALKILHAKLADEDAAAISRFRTEATAASRVKSAYVVQVIAAGVDATSGPWIAMEYLHGSDLFDWVASHGPMPWPQARQVLQHLCHALAAAHYAGIVHRDLKPENIFLAESAGLEAPFITKILDFGIAKAFEGTSSTTAGIGSWAWLAPEQASVHSRVTPATDVWALGLVAFFLLTGKSYWLAFQKGAEGSILRELGQDHFEAASARAARLGCHVHLPAGFDGWFASCVAQTGRFPDARFAGGALPGASIPSVPAVVHTIPSMESVHAQSGSFRPQWPTWWPLLGGASAVVGVGAIALWLASEPKPPVVVEKPTGSATSTPTQVATDAPVEMTLYTQPLRTEPGCSVDCSAGCEHVLVSAGPAFGFFEDLARRQRREQSLCSEISRLSRRPTAPPADQFSYSLWVPKGWQAPGAWRDPQTGTVTIPGTRLPLREDSIRVPEMRGLRVFPPTCNPDTLSFTQGARRLVGRQAKGECELTPPVASTERGEVWSWRAASEGYCSCLASDKELPPLRELGKCLLTCRVEPKEPCVDACEESTPGTSRLR